MKKPWRDFAIEYIRKTGFCPGDEPPFGLPTDLVTIEDFNMSVQATGIHSYADCHFTDELIGFRLDEELKEVTLADDAKVSKAANQVRGNAAKMIEVNKVNLLKTKLVKLVHSIEYRQGGVLYVPGDLMRLENFIHRELSRD